MLKTTLKRILWHIVRFSGIPLILREVILKNKVTIIFYHDPKPDIFLKHVKYLYKHYNFIPLARLVDAIRTRSWRDIPPKALVLTLDDGHKGNHKLLAIFETYNFQPTIYICSHVVNTNRSFWWKTSFACPERLKNLPNELMSRVLEEETGYFPEREYAQRQALNEMEIREMLPYVDFQSHTKFHPILTNCSKQRSLDEIQNSKKTLELLLNRPVEHFSYPNGDYGEREVEYAKRSSYRSARTRDWGWNDIKSDPYRLKTIIINEQASISKLCAQITGCFRYIEWLHNKLVAA